MFQLSVGEQEECMDDAAHEEHLRERVPTACKLCMLSRKHVSPEQPPDMQSMKMDTIMARLSLIHI